MYSKTIRIDKKGKITIPKQVLDILKLGDASEKGEVIIELTDQGILIKPKKSATPITDELATMSVPVADWDQMEKEIYIGRVA